MIGNLRRQRIALGLRRQLAKRCEVALAHVVDARQRVAKPIGSGSRRHIEQRVGDTAHRRHDDGRTAAVARPRGSHDLDQSADRVGIGDGRAAEFLDNH